MNLNDAIARIQNYMSKMNALYGDSVFDETILVQFCDGVPSILHYCGPREVDVDQEFFEDLSGLTSGLKSRKFGPGDFEFTREGTGKAFDAFLVLGLRSCLICNNTTRSTTEITASPAWRKAQRPFVDLGEDFRASPLVVE